MATVSTYRDDSLPMINSGVRHVQKVLDLAADAANNGDAIQVLGIAPQQKGFISHAVLRTSATLGAGCTAQLRVNRGGVFTTLTAATTAGAASKATDAAQAGVPFSYQGGDVIEVLIGGADMAAAATVTVDFETSAHS